MCMVLFKEQRAQGLGLEDTLAFLIALLKNDCKNWECAQKSMFNVFVYRNGWCMLEGHLGRRSPFREGGVSRLRQVSYSNVANPPSQLRIHVRTNSTLRPLASNTIQTLASAPFQHPTPASQVCACHWHQNITLMPPLLIDTCILVTTDPYPGHRSHPTPVEKMSPCALFDAQRGNACLIRYINPVVSYGFSSV